MKSLLLIALIAVAISARTFKIVGDHFEMDGKPFSYVSGSFHYFRQRPEEWENTLKKMANGGLNAVQTYVAWNLHEPRKGEFNFAEEADIVRFLQIAQKLNMYVIFRPGPYICAEWDFGGLPSWLVNEPNIRIRRTDPIYQKHVEDYFNVLLPMIRPYLYANGGPIISVQIENEYGFFDACDKNHLRWLLNLNKRILGNDVVYFTVDTPNDDTQSCGSLAPEIYPTVDFGVRDAASAFEVQMKYAGNGPKVNTEFYPGWLDHWQDKHHKVDAYSIARTLDQMLSLNASVNFYMYFGGTNHHFFAGANGDRNSYMSDPTSYDYDAPLTEAGDMTEKWGILRDTIAKYFPIAKWPVENTPAKSYGDIELTQSAPLMMVLPSVAGRCVVGEKPLGFEKLDTDYGYVHYKINTNGGKLRFQNKVHDRAYFIVGDKFIDWVQRDREHDVIIPAGLLDIVVENMGRINFGSDMFEEKGIIGDVLLDDTPLLGFTMCVMPLKTVKSIPFGNTVTKDPMTFYRATFNVDIPANTYVNPSGFKKGVIFINDVNIGRYWTVGPQLTLFVPASILKKGENEIVIFEHEGTDSTKVSFDAKPQIDII